MSHTGKLVASGVCTAFGVILPFLFHIFGAAGSVFLPMHIPVMIAGLLLGTRWGLLVGGMTPVLSNLLTGMPPAIPVLPVMAAELAVYGWMGGYLHQERRLPLWPALIGAMVAGRAAAMLAAFCIVSLLHVTLSPFVYITGAIVQGLPGIALQLAVVPVFVDKLERAFGGIPGMPVK